MIRAFVHVGLSVVSLERSIAFYETGFGFVTGTPKRFDDARYRTILDLPDAVGRVVLLRSSALTLELFEFETPRPRRREARRPVSDHGISHFAVEVDDMEVAVERLRNAGATFHCPPLLFPGIATATYGRDPDGNAFELIRFPDIL